MAQNQKRSDSRSRRLQDIRKTVDESVNAAEDIHKRIADLPLEILAEVGFEEAIKRVREIQDRSIHAVYELVRDINQEVVDLASNVLPASRGRGKPAVKAPSKARASAAA